MHIYLISDFAAIACKIPFIHWGQKNQFVLERSSENGTFFRYRGWVRQRVTFCFIIIIWSMNMPVVKKSVCFNICSFRIYQRLLVIDFCESFLAHKKNNSRNAFWAYSCYAFSIYQRISTNHDSSTYMELKMLSFIHFQNCPPSIRKGISRKIIKTRINLFQAVLFLP